MDEGNEPCHLRERWVPLVAGLTGEVQLEELGVQEVVHGVASGSTSSDSSQSHSMGIQPQTTTPTLLETTSEPEATASAMQRF